MRIGTAKVTKEIDEYCINKLCIPSSILMENAAGAVLDEIQNTNAKSFTIICGIGNNGGDGLCLARKLIVLGKSVRIFIFSPDSKSEDYKLNYNILKNMGVTFKNINNEAELINSILNCEIVIDAIFGTGLNRKLNEEYIKVIDIINKYSKCTISIDVPSGMDSDDGKLYGGCIKADKTITFETYKRGFLHYGNELYCGSISVAKIGIPEFVLNMFCNSEFIVDTFMLSGKIIRRGKYGNKGDFGRVSILAGSNGMPGAAYMCTTAAVRSGAGLVTLYSSTDVVQSVKAKLVEAMSMSIGEESFEEKISKSDVIAFGPGMGNNSDTLELMKKIFQIAKCPIVIDADGINVLQNNIELLKNYRNKIVLTPHPGEMSRITGYTVKYINENRMDVAFEFAQKYNVIVLLKGYNTVITDGKNIMINPTGSSAMSSGGMGDCLTGIIAAFIGQGHSPLDAAVLGAYVHGYCGDELAQKQYSVSAQDLLEYLPCGIKKVSDIGKIDNN